MSFPSLVSKGIERIYSEDLANQKVMLSALCDVVRKRDEIAPLLEAQAFFVPNNEYLVNYFGPAVLDVQYDLYDWDGKCLWDNFLVMPIPNLVGEYCGFVGFDPHSKAEPKEGEHFNPLPKYRYSNSNVFVRSRYIYMLRGVYEKAVRDGYIILSDGNFDMLYLHHEGFNAGSMLGSVVSEEVIFLLSFIEHVFVAEDMDLAGRELFEKIARRRHRNTHYLRQNIAWDSDDALKGPYRQQYVDFVWDAVTKKQSKAMRFKPWKLSAGLYK